jgi:uncharacterized membrane protein YdjX (TVP38/TMEM64 family)
MSIEHATSTTTTVVIHQRRLALPRSLGCSLYSVVHPSSVSKLEDSNILNLCHLRQLPDRRSNMMIRCRQNIPNLAFMMTLTMTLLWLSVLHVCHGGSARISSGDTASLSMERETFLLPGRRNTSSRHPLYFFQSPLQPSSPRGFSVSRRQDYVTLSLSIPRGGFSRMQPPQQSVTPQRRRAIAKAAKQQPPSLVVTQKTVLLAAGSILAAVGLWYHRAVWTSLFNKEKLQQSAVATLSRLNELPKVSSYSSYILGMALWEAAGLSTIPVETAAGMVFGWPDGFVLNAVGKLTGAALAFGLGRSPILGPTMQQQFATNKFLQSIQATTRQNPLRTAFLLKIGPLPETIKNFGSAFLKPIRWWMFLLATMIHGWTFSALWTYLGVDTAARLEDVQGLLPPDRVLQLLLALALVNGIAISPLSMVWLCYNPSSKNEETKGKKKKGTRK